MAHNIAPPQATPTPALPAVPPSTPAASLDAILVLAALIPVIWCLSFFVPGLGLSTTGSFWGPSGAGPLYLLQLPVRGFVKHAEVIGFVFVCGAAINVFASCGSLYVAFTCANTLLGSYRTLLVTILVVLLSLAGATVGLSEELVPLAALMSPWLLSIGLDGTRIAAALLLGTQAGFAAAFVNPFNLGVAANIASVTPDTGYRLVCWITLTVEAVLLVLFFCRGLPHRTATRRPSPPSKRQFTALLVLTACLVVCGVGVCAHSWSLLSLSAGFLAASILTCLVVPLSQREQDGNAPSGKPPRPAADLRGLSLHLQGAREMFRLASVLALAGGLRVLLEDTGWPSLAGSWLKSTSAVAHFFPQAFLKLLVPSASAQAAITMPIVAASDIDAHAKDASVLAYQLADGLTLLISPTSGVVFGVLTVLGVSYRSWLSLALKAYSIMALTALALIAVFAHLIHPA